MKQRDAGWVMLVGAALDTRDSLRVRFIPALDRLARMTDNRTAVELIGDLRRESTLQADRLRLAVKGRIHK